MFERPQFDPAQSQSRCLKLRRRILDISQTVSALHMAGAYSCMEIVEAIYFNLMRRDASGDSPDTFLMSKGHGCMAQYVALEELGVLSSEHIAKYCKADGILGCHPDYGNPGIEASTGSLGHGLNMALGMAAADKVAEGDGKDRQIYVVLSDGELQEGSVWEGILMAPALNLKNVVAFVDYNDFQSLGRTSETHPNFYPLVEKLEAFGWQSLEVKGHNSHELVEAVLSRDTSKPLFVVAETTKGKGLSFMENEPIWHYRSPSPEEYQQAMKEFEEAENA